MTTSWWLLFACLLAGAVVAGWPGGATRLGQRRQQARRWRSPDLAGLRARMAEIAEHPRQVVLLTALALCAVGWLVSGLIAGVLAAVYGALTARALIRRAARGRATVARARSLDELCALAADLRAGLPPVAVMSAAQADFVSTGPALPTDGRRTPVSRVSTLVASSPGERRLDELTAAVWRLAEHTGAPAAELVERIEADARAADRAHASAAAQAAGAQATALLLAALPLGGIALGYGIGVDPLQILLHTPLGGACAIGAALLQTAGLLWADRLATGPTR
jgi:tight adherence protein B